MNRDDIVRMAREASGGTVWWPINSDALERFATLVATAEREECAKVCEEYDANNPYIGQAKACAAAIRTRGEK